MLKQLPQPFPDGKASEVLGERWGGDRGAPLLQNMDEDGNT